LPGYSPFNVANIDGRLFVAFAKPGPPDFVDEMHGPGLGFVEVFDGSGNMLMRLQHGNWLNAPWGIVRAPANFGPWSLRLLVGQFGSGQIATYNALDGSFLGLLPGPHGDPISIDGLWGLSFGNDNAAGPSNVLYFSAGIDDEAHGLFGSLTAIR
jgi:uncharacterized protein (TIGR03118 family)